MGPFDWEEDRGGEEIVQVKRIARVLPEIVAFKHEMRTEILFQAGVIHVANSRQERNAGLGSEDVGRQAACAGGAGEHQIFIERSFVGMRIGYPQHRLGRRNQVGQARSGLRLGAFADAVVAVPPEPQVECQLAEVDAVLSIERLLPDVGMTVVSEQGAAPGEVVGHEPGREIGIGLKSRFRALARIDQSRIQHGIAIGVETDGVEGRIGQPEGEFLRENGVRDLHPELGIVAAVQIVKVGFHTDVSQASGLAERGRLVGKGIAARVVVDQIPPHEHIRSQRGSGIEYMDPTGPNAERTHHLLLILPGSHLVVLIGNLKPVAGGQHVQMEHIRTTRLIVRP